MTRPLILSLLLSVIVPCCHGWLPSGRIQLTNDRTAVSSTPLYLFSLNFNQDNKDNNKKDRDPGSGEAGNGKTKKAQSPGQVPKVNVGPPSDDLDVVDSDFPTWVEGLRNWPRYPSMESLNGYRRRDNRYTSTPSDESTRPTTAPAQTEPEDIWSSRYRGSSPLSNLINLEALLDASTSSKSEGSTGSGVKNETESSFLNIFAITEQLMKMSSSLSAANDNMKNQQFVQEEVASNLENITTVEEFVAFEKWMETISKSVMMGGSSGSSAASPPTTLSDEAILKKLVEPSTTGPGTPGSPSAASGSSFSAEKILKEATSRIEFLVNVSSSALSPSRFQSLLVKANEALSWTGVDSVTDNILQSAAQAAQERGLDVQQVTERAKETTKFAVEFVTVANNLFGAGYAYEAGLPGNENAPGNAESSATAASTGKLPANYLKDPAASPDIKPLFADFESARVLNPLLYEKVLAKVGEMGSVAGTIYEDSFQRCRDLGHILVANGTTAEVAWMVTDSVGYEKDFHEAESTISHQNEAPTQVDKPILIRTITVRGFDASDETVDREKLLNTICSASGEMISSDPRVNSFHSNVMFHSGLLSTARQLYKELKRFIESASPEHHRIVFNGHSIGGSLSILMLLLATVDIGGTYSFISL